MQSMSEPPGWLQSLAALLSYRDFMKGFLMFATLASARESLGVISLDRMKMPLVLLCAVASIAADKPQSRPFDNYRAIFAVCVYSLNAEWTTDARKYLLDEVNRRAVRENLLVSIDNDLSPDKFREEHGLTTEQVIWLVMTFEDSSAYKGGVNLTFNAPHFYLQGAVFDPGTSFAKAKPALDRMLDGFFDYGKGK